MASASGARRRSMLLGTIVVLLFAASTIVAVTSQQGLPWASRTTAKAAFDDVGSLREGDDVRIANVRVGYVGKLVYQDGLAIADLRFDGERPIYRDARAVAASVGARSALGQKYVDFAPGTPASGLRSPDEVLPAKRTVGAQELSDVLDVFDEPTRAGLGSTVREAGGGAAGHVGDFRDTLHTMPSMLPNLGTVADSLSSRGGADLTSMLRSVDSFSGRFEGRQQQIGQLLGRMDKTLGAVNADSGKPLAAALAAAPDALHKTDGALSTLRRPLADTGAAMQAARPGAEALGRATPDVRGVLREAPRPLDKVPGVAEQAQPAVTELTGAFRDLRPLAPRTAQALATGRTPLQTLSPYAPEVSMWFTYAANALSQGDGAGNFLRIFPLINTESVSGTLPVKDPLSTRNAYPAPGQAPKDSRNTLLGGGR